MLPLKKQPVYDTISYRENKRPTADHAPTRAKAAAFTVPVTLVDAAIAGLIGGAVAGTGFSLSVAAIAAVPCGFLSLLTYAMCSAAGEDDELSGR